MTKHKVKIFAITSIIFLLILSCSSVATSTDNIESTATIQISTSIPTNTPTLVPTEIVSTLTPSPPESILKFQHFEIRAELPSDGKLMGSLVLCGDSSISLLRFSPDIKAETLVENVRNVLCYPPSPDGKWIAYEQDSKDSPTGSWLGVVSADGQQQKKIAKNPDWFNFVDYAWLDNQHLVFSNFRNPPETQRTLANPAYPVVVINPFTGKHIELSSDYPGLHLGINGPVGTLAFNYSDVVYDPSLNLVIFPAWGGEHNYIVLWDRHTKAVLAKVEYQSGGFGRYPLWSPDATQFAVAVVNEQRVGTAIDEWYRVSREGQVEQLTHFGNYFSSSEIGSSSNWSPDGQKLAFWIDLSPSPCPGLSLAILDTTTKQVTNTCLLGTWHSYWPPIWSLDSRYIIILDANSTPIKTILINAENNQAFDITSLVGDSYPVGWAVSP